MDKDRKIRIAVTGLRGVPASWGGVEHHCENLYSRLVTLGYQVTVYARHYYVPKDISNYKGMMVKRLPTLYRKYTDALFHTFLSVLHIIFSRQDIIHIHGIGPAFFSWIPRLFRPRMKVCFTCHGLDWQRKKWPAWARRLIYLGELCAVKFTHRRIVVSRQLQQYFTINHQVSTDYIPNGIVPVPYRPAEVIREQWNLSCRGYFLFVGRLVPEKRVEDIIAAYLACPRSFPLVIVGDEAAGGGYLEGLKKQAAGSPQVIFTGYQFGRTLEELLGNARAFITASELEGLPISLLEALSAGVMCATSSIAPHEEITSGLPVLSFAVGDVVALAGQLDQIEKMSNEEFDRFKEKSQAMVLQNFSWEEISQTHDHLYRRLLADSDKAVKDRQEA